MDLLDKTTNYTFLKCNNQKVDCSVINNKHNQQYKKQLDDKKTCCYIAENVYEDKMYYFIKHKNGVLFDPLRADDTTYARMDWKYKKVTLDVFFLYLKYMGAMKEFKKFKGKKYLLSQAESLMN